MCSNRRDMGCCLKFIFAILTLSATFVCANVVPSLSTKELVGSSDLVIVGRVESVQQTGEGSVTFKGVTYRRLDFQADMSVDETIKGEPVPSKFTFSYSSPSADKQGNVARGGLLSKFYGVVFLTERQRGINLPVPIHQHFPQALGRVDRIGMSIWEKTRIKGYCRGSWLCCARIPVLEKSSRHYLD